MQRSNAQPGQSRERPGRHCGHDHRGEFRPGATTVTFNGVAATINTITATQITTTVPSGAPTGPLTVVTADGSASLTFTVTATPANQPPVVSAGPDHSITLPSTAVLSGSVFDDGLPGGPLTIAWSKVSGPGMVVFSSPSALATTASFSAAGTYVLRLTASDSALMASDDVTVTVSAIPNP
jgi:uncharacterized protein (TIGR03437 family)